MNNQWQVTANAAELYEELLVPTTFKPWAEDLLALAALREGDRVLDVACGTGIVARMAAERVGVAGAVTGLDLNPGMIRVARSVPAPSGAPVTWVEGSALKMPLPDTSFAVVLCQQRFQFLPDQGAGLSEFRRVLVGDGRILLSVWEGETPYTRALSTAVERHAGAQAAVTLRTSRICPNRDALQLLVSQAGSRDVRVPRAHGTQAPSTDCSLRVTPSCRDPRGGCHLCTERIEFNWPMTRGQHWHSIRIRMETPSSFPRQHTL